jgi:hypothetical protein
MNKFLILYRLHAYITNGEETCAVCVSPSPHLLLGGETSPYPTSQDTRSKEKSQDQDQEKYAVESVEWSDA